MLSPGSPEVKLKNGLRELYCAESNFAKISGIIGKTRLIEGLSGQKNFESEHAKRMLEVLEEMRELQQAVGDLPIDWSRAEQISMVMSVRRLDKIDKELTGSDVFYEAAKRATAELL